MATKPTELPRFAELDQASPLATNNVIEPPESYKKYGHTFREKYKRNFLNWLHRLTYEWLLWLQQSQESGTLALKMYHDTGDFSNPIGCTLVSDALHFNAQWCRTNNVIHIQPISTASGEILGTIDVPLTPNHSIKLGLQSGNWPNAFVKTYHSRASITVRSDNAQVPSKIEIGPIAADSSGDWLISSPPMPAVQGNVNDIDHPSGTSGLFQNIIGIEASTISFMVGAIT